MAIHLNKNNVLKNIELYKSHKASPNEKFIWEIDNNTYPNDLDKMNKHRLDIRNAILYINELEITY